MNDVGAIILAAGLSRRMGACNKLLLPISGVPMIRHVVDVYSGVARGGVLVVTGHEAEAVEAVLEGSGARAVFNADYAQGQVTSVACGLRAMGKVATLLIGLGDQPLLNRADLNALLDAHRVADPARVSIPMQGDQRGNPIVVPDNLRNRMLADPTSPGCRKFTRANPDHVQFHALPSAGFYTDLDTPAAYAAYLDHALEDVS